MSRKRSSNSECTPPQVPDVSRSGRVSSFSLPRHDFAFGSATSAVAVAAAAASASPNANANAAASSSGNDVEDHTLQRETGGSGVDVSHSGIGAFATSIAGAVEIGHGDQSSATPSSAPNDNNTRGAAVAPPSAEQKYPQEERFQAQVPAWGFPPPPKPAAPSPAFSDLYASLFPPLLSQYAPLHPHFPQITTDQQQLVLSQQHLLMQHLAQQSMQFQQQQTLQRSSQHQAAAASATVSQPQRHTTLSDLYTAAQNAEAAQHRQMQMAQQSIIQQQFYQHSIQQLILQQQQSLQSTQAATATSATATAHGPFPAQPTPRISPEQLSQGLTNATFLQAPPLNLNLNLNNNSLRPQDIQAIYQADDSNNYPAHPYHHDSDDDEDSSGPPSQRLLHLIEDHRWVAAFQRISTHPREIQQVGIQGRLPLHVACDHDAPPALVQAILRAWPEGVSRVGTSHMNPLHITCSSPHASVDVVRVLLAGYWRPMDITGAKDVDGDTPLHAATRCAAPMDVLVTLLQANPATVMWKDYEGLNPLMRLWVRYFVLVGEQIISNIKSPGDLKGDLIEAWQKSLLLLQVMSAMERQGRLAQPEEPPFRVVHAAASVDCPRCVVRIAAVLFPRELLYRDEDYRLPLHIAAAAPVYAVHDLRGEGYTIEDASMMFEAPEQRMARFKAKVCKYKEPSVIDILLGGAPAAASERDRHGQLPLHVAIMRGKTLDEGVQALVEAHPDALTSPDKQTNLYPFMLAASVGRGRGDCATIYALLRAAPELVHMALGNEGPEDEFIPKKQRDDSS